MTKSIQPTAGAVTSEQKRASKIGTDILLQGGNAVDAIIATTIAVNTLAPYHSDIGGGGFAIIRQSDGQYTGLDFRHCAPHDVTMEFYQKGASTHVGGSAVAVPGQMRGLYELHERYGKLEWTKLLQPSIRLAKAGAEICEDLRTFTLRECKEGADDIAGTWYESDPMYHSLFKNGKVRSIGDIWQRPEYARTLEMIAEHGADAFYEGEIAQGMVDEIQKRGGLMTLEDLKAYRARWCKPIKSHYRGHTLWTVPAPASGAIWLAGMGILDEFEAPGEGTVMDYHRVTEAMRLAYGQRFQLGDPTYVPEVPGIEATWLDSAYVKKRAAMISDDHTHPPAFYIGSDSMDTGDNGTSNITVADQDGMVVSITTTVGLNWGSHIMVPGYGFVLNDSIDDFSVAGQTNRTGYEPSKANYVEGGKRPLSSSCPYIVENRTGKPVLAGGAAGGSTIISANIQVVRNVLDYGLSAAEALRAARLHNQILPNVSQLERPNGKHIKIDGFSENVAEGLKAKGHVIEWVTANRSTPCAMRFLPDGGWEAEGDPRKNDSGGSVVRP